MLHCNVDIDYWCFHQRICCILAPAGEIIPEKHRPLLSFFFKAQTKYAIPPMLTPTQQYMCYYFGQGHKTGHPTKHNKTSSWQSIQGYYRAGMRYKKYFKIV